MPVYEEKNPKWYWAVLFLLPVFLAVYSPFHFGSRELHGSEGIYAAMVMEINLLVPLTVAHGELIPSSYPLFPWVASLLHICGVKMELVLRIVSIASLAVLSGIVWQAAKKALNNQAGVVAAAAMFSSVIVIEKTLDGYPDMLAIVFIFSGWMLWFMYGASRGNWDKAWIVSVFSCGLAFYTIGWTAVIYFFWPLIFMRRPLTVWPKLKKRGFAISLFVLLAFILFWGIPRWIGGEDIPFRDLKFDKDIFEGYLVHVLSFPFEFALRFMPWTLLAWAPFCVAFHPLDKKSHFQPVLEDNIHLHVFSFLAHSLCGYQGFDFFGSSPGCYDRSELLVAGQAIRYAHSPPVESDGICTGGVRWCCAGFLFIARRLVFGTFLHVP